MDIKQLKTFICIAETGSLSAASDRLRIAQPALSRQIKLLEHEIGVQLFLRHARGMTLTETGQTFFKSISKLIYQLEKSVDDISSVKGEIKGTVNIGFLPSSNMDFITRFVGRVKKQLPDVKLNLVEGFSGNLIEWLQGGSLDISFLNGPAKDLHISSKELIYEDIVLISAKGTLPQLGENIVLSDLAQLPLALPNRTHGIRILIDRIIQKFNIELDVALHVDSIAILRSLVRSGDYHTLLPLSCFADEIAKQDFETRVFKSSTMNRQLILGFAPNGVTTVAMDAVTNIIYDEIMTMIEQGQWDAIATDDLKKITSRPS